MVEISGAQKKKGKGAKKKTEQGFYRENNNFGVVLNAAHAAFLNSYIARIGSYWMVALHFGWRAWDLAREGFKFGFGEFNEEKYCAGADREAHFCYRYNQESLLLFEYYNKKHYAVWHRESHRHVRRSPTFNTGRANPHHCSKSSCVSASLSAAPISN